MKIPAYLLIEMVKQQKNGGLPYSEGKILISLGLTLIE